MVAAYNLTKQFGEQLLFENATFTIGEGERVGLVGRNGHGKSTLFRLISGEEEPDSGLIQIPKGYSIGFLKQEYYFTRGTVVEEACLGLHEDRRHEEWEAKKILAGLGFSDEDFQKPPSMFSGGFQIRINLAKVLLSEPQLLLLDEPTNFLDVVSIRWLERYLNGWKGEFIIISHDRAFMDKVTTHIMGIHRKRIRKFNGKTGSYYEQLAMEEEVHEKQRVNQEKKTKQLEEFISRFRAKARQANMVQSRIKVLEKQALLAKLDYIPTLSFDFRYQPAEMKYALDAKNLSFAYAEEQPLLIDNLSFTIEPDDRIGIIGKNGKGKTTLLKLLAGKIASCKGSIVKHPQSRISFFEQANTAELREELTVEEEIMSAMVEPDRRKARDICGAMMFTGDTALKRIAVLSGGEKCRVLIGKILVNPSNLLLLDEPTHHLDIESTESLMDALLGFDGACAIVTHNERILERVVNKLIIFQGGKVFPFNGPYEQFLEEIGWEEADEGAPSSRRAKGNRKELRKLRADFNARKSAILTPLKREMEKLEREIAIIEKRGEEEMERLLEFSKIGDGAKIAEISISIDKDKALMDKYFEKLCELDAVYSTEKAKLDTEE